MKLGILLIISTFSMTIFANNCHIVIEPISPMRYKKLMVDPYVWNLDHQQTKEQLFVELEENKGFVIFPLEDADKARFIVTDYYRLCTVFKKKKSSVICMKAIASITFFDQMNESSFTYFSSHKKTKFSQGPKHTAFDRALKQIPHCGYKENK